MISEETAWSERLFGCCHLDDVRRTLFDLELLEWDAELDDCFLPAVGNLALEHWQRLKRDEDLRIGPLPGGSGSRIIDSRGNT
jgi:hypothetical protein